MPDDNEYRVYSSPKKRFLWHQDWATPERNEEEDEEFNERRQRTKYIEAHSSTEYRREWHLWVGPSQGQFEPVNHEPWNDDYVPKPDPDWQPWSFAVNQDDVWGEHDDGYAPDEQTAMMKAIKACDAMEGELIGIPWDPNESK